jgi:hypothetical protein
MYPFILHRLTSIFILDLKLASRQSRESSTLLDRTIPVAVFDRTSLFTRSNSRNTTSEPKKIRSLSKDGEESFLGSRRQSSSQPFAQTQSNPQQVQALQCDDRNYSSRVDAKIRQRQEVNDQKPDEKTYVRTDTRQSKRESTARSSFVETQVTGLSSTRRVSLNQTSELTLPVMRASIPSGRSPSRGNSRLNPEATLFLPGLVSYPDTPSSRPQNFSGRRRGQSVPLIFAPESSCDSDTEFTHSATSYRNSASPSIDTPYTRSPVPSGYNRSLPLARRGTEPVFAYSATNKSFLAVPSRSQKTHISDIDENEAIESFPSKEIRKSDPAVDPEPFSSPRMTRLGSQVKRSTSLPAIGLTTWIKEELTGSRSSKSPPRIRRGSQAHNPCEIVPSPPQMVIQGQMLFEAIPNDAVTENDVADASPATERLPVQLPEYFPRSWKRRRMRHRLPQHPADLAVVAKRLSTDDDGGATRALTDASNPAANARRRSKAYDGAAAALEAASSRRKRSSASKNVLPGATGSSLDSSDNVTHIIATAPLNGIPESSTADSAVSHSSNGRLSGRRLGDELDGEEADDLAQARRHA